MSRRESLFKGSEIPLGQITGRQLRSQATGGLDAVGPRGPPSAASQRDTDDKDQCDQGEPLLEEALRLTDSEQILAGTARGINQNSSRLFYDGERDVGVICRLNGSSRTEENEFHGCLSAETAKAMPATAIGFLIKSIVLPPAGFPAGRILR